jgi:exodeoxyribonuclease-1
MQNTYLFYDLETTGLNKCFDQVLQFAAIRTDKELNELEQYEIKVKLNPDVIPSPKALITHNINIKEMQNGSCEYEAIRDIHKLMNQPGTISLGYNTLGFDDEFLRFSFHRNLLRPYTHQYANGCGRMDILPMIVMYYLYKKDVLQWPNNLKLENLNAANQLTAGNAHDAMVDVKITLELARRFIKHRDMWDYLCGYFDKETDLARMLKLPEAIMVDVKFGADNDYQIPVLSLGTHNHYKNQTLWLRLDSDELKYVKRKKPGEAYLLLPPNKTNINQKRLELSANNKEKLQQNPKLLQEITDYHKEFTYPKIPNLDADAALYQNGFLSADELSLCADFHAASVVDKIAMITKFSNLNLREQAIRILGRNYLYLPNRYALEFEDYLRRINPNDETKALLNYKGEPRLTPVAALKEIAELKNTEKLNTQQILLLNDLENYIFAKYIN